MKPFATLGSEISKVRERVRRGAESLRPSKVAHDVRDQRDRLLAKLGEQTFRLIAERKLVVPKVLQEPVERLAALLGVQLPPLDPNAPSPSQAPTERAAGANGETDAEVASHPIAESREPDEVDEPSRGDADEALASSSAAPTRPATTQASATKDKKAQKKGGKRSKKR